MNVSDSNSQGRQITRTINPSPGNYPSLHWKISMLLAIQKEHLFFNFSLQDECGQKTRWFISSLKQQFIRLPQCVNTSEFISLIWHPNSVSLRHKPYVISLEHFRIGWTYFTESNFLDFGLSSPNLEGKNEDSEPGNSKQLLFLLLSQTFSKKSGVRYETDLKRKNPSKKQLVSTGIFFQDFVQ